MAGSARRWLRRVVKVAAAIAAMILVAALAGKWWILPAVIRWQLDEHLSEYWQGRAVIDQVGFHYFGPVEFHGVSLTDGAGREWFRAESIRLDLRDWPSLHPLLTRLSVRRPTVTAHVADGRCRPPLRKIPSELWTEYVDLEEAAVTAGALAIVEDGRPAWRGDDLSATLRRQDGRYELRLGSASKLVLADLQAESFRLTDEVLEVGRLVGGVGSGRIIASLAAAVRGEGVFDLRGQVALKQVDLASLALPIRGMAKGLATGLCDLRAEQSCGGQLRGGGMLFVENADLRNVPAAVEVLRHAGLTDPAALVDADVEICFQLQGTAIALDRTRVSLRMAAVDVEPGGTLDLRTGQVDLCAVIILFEKVRDLLKRVPLVSLAVDLTENLCRYRVRGRWDDTESLTVSSEPIKGIGDASKLFLMGAARGGKVGNFVINGLSGLFRPPDSQPAGSGPAPDPRMESRKVPGGDGRR